MTRLSLVGTAWATPNYRVTIRWAVVQRGLTSISSKSLFYGRAKRLLCCRYRSLVSNFTRQKENSQNFLCLLYWTDHGFRLFLIYSDMTWWVEQKLWLWLLPSVEISTVLAILGKSGAVLIFCVTCTISTASFLEGVTALFNGKSPFLALAYRLLIGLCGKDSTNQKTGREW